MKEDIVLELKNIYKYFPGVVALDNMSFKVKKGEVHGLIGENGAGKSTLMKIISGVHKPEKGKIFLDGKLISFNNPVEPIEKGIGCIYQELNIVPNMTITDNLFINYYEKKNILVDYKKMNEKANNIMEQLGYSIDVKTKCYELGLGLQQIVEIGKSILRNSKIIIMDEPTSSLSGNEISKLKETIKKLKEKDISIIFISHKLEEIFEICDTVTVMRDGKHISTSPVEDMTNDDLVRDMVGRDMSEMYPEINHHRGSEMLRVEGLNVLGIIDDVNFKAYKGEILGFSGLVGAGRSETMRAIFGMMDKNVSGEIYIEGEKVDIKHPIDAIRNNIAFLTEDRKGEGLVLIDTVLNNLHLSTINKYIKYGFFLDNEKRKQIANNNVENYNIKTPSLETPVANLSGGNQQKVVIGNWINTDADIIIFDEPTRGIDVGAKREIYNVINLLASNGKCVIIVSSELPEILGMSDRVIVMRSGKITAKIERGSKYFNSEDIMKASWGENINEGK